MIALTPSSAYASHLQSAAPRGRHRRSELLQSRPPHPGNQYRHRLRGRRSAPREWRKCLAGVRVSDPSPLFLHSPSPAGVLRPASRDEFEPQSLFVAGGGGGAVWCAVLGELSFYPPGFFLLKIN